jgi:hypothetical protein
VKVGAPLPCKSCHYQPVKVQLGAPYREPPGVKCVWPTSHQRILTTPSYGSLVKWAAAGPPIISLMLDRGTALPPLISI